MKPSKTIKYKALFLLVSFSLNSVVGFACSLGLDMGFNSSHHSHEGEEKHEHKPDGDAKGHNNHHHEDGVHKHKHNHNESGEHKGGNTVQFNAPSEDNCCKDFVVGFQSLDKQLVQKPYSVKQKTEYAPFVLPATINVNKQVYTEPVRTPPKIPYHSPPDIRVFIQSFQI